MRFVRVVTNTRSERAARRSISPIRSSICPSVGRTSTPGSTRPVGRSSCSTTLADFSRSYFDGVADANIVVPMYPSNSSNFRGRLS